MRQAHGTLTVRTGGCGFVDITRRVDEWLSEQRVLSGLLTVFIRHTSASLIIQENADPTVRDDLVDALGRLAPTDHPYRHDLEGPDDMPAHIKSAITSTSLSIPVLDGRMALGTWQGIYVAEHRAHPHERQIVLHYLGQCDGDD